MRKLAVATVALLLVASGCFGGGGETRTVITDYKHDEFASAFLWYFPERVEAHPGDTVVFRQAWTGEPHSVTMGTIVNEYGEIIEPYRKTFKKEGWAGLPPEPPKKLAKYEERLPWMTGEKGQAAQNGAQPCYLTKGTPPTEDDKPCTDAQQRQPEFTGRHSYYNSGFIPYEGPSGDIYTVKISEDARPGEHFFYCNFHGPFMSGFLEVQPKSQRLASSAAAAREANKEIAAIARPLQRAFEAAQRGRWSPPKMAREGLEELGLTKQRGRRTYVDAWLSGIAVPGTDNAMINEFVPRNIRARAGEELTWVMFGGHTISFNVPKYFPIIQVRKDGTVRRNPKLDPPAGGAPPIPDQEGGGGGPPEPIVIDAGRWNGRGFWSSGLIYSEVFTAYSLRITRRGTYKFACLVHPPMVGTLRVT